MFYPDGGAGESAAAPAPAPAPLPQAGWMPDPSSPTYERYWDGQRWTTHTRPRTAVAAPVTAPAPGPAWSPHTPTSHGPSFSAPAYPATVPPRRSRASRALGLLVPVAVAAGIASMVSGGWGSTPERVQFTVVEDATAAPIAPDTPYGTYSSTPMAVALEPLLVTQAPAIDVTQWAHEHGTDAILAAVGEAAIQSPYVYVDLWTVRELAGTFTLQPNYVYDDEEAERRRSETRQAAADALVAAGVAGAASDAEKASLIHHYIVTAATYDTQASDALEVGRALPIVQQSQEAYGILVEGSAVCTGYAMAFTAMAELAGLDAVTVTGTDSTSELSAGHAWNKVLVDGRWVLVDTTWDDPDQGPRDISTEYLLVKDGDPLLSTRVADEDWMMPESRREFGA
ncbi:transglutaminase domain-containing protein [Demequina activiva]|uniref:Transglutaminase-like domain-containing protein n=1 Tax=Demequina activiva TaxID=1582364 RepID=A0A919Q4X3_9MICO|nr:transglutaminase domain-containing protein [Demequina activiva]GIG54348.1 hypothetical protein Dac01nite_11000 [Demequina activiva]